MTPPANLGEITPLSHIVLLTAAEQVWPGQVPQWSLSDVARNLRSHIETFPCLQWHNTVERLLAKIDTVKTNGDFIAVTEEIFRIVGIIRKSLEKSGVLRHAAQPHEPMIATVSVPDTLPGAMPIDNIKRLQANSAFLMILHYTNRILSVLAQASLTIQNRTSESSKPIALVDAQPITVPWEKPEKKKIILENHSGNETKPEDFIWFDVKFDPRMVLIPILASLYREWRKEISYEELEKMAGTSAISTKANKISEKFTAAWKPIPFKTIWWQGIQFIYDSSHEINPVQDEWSVWATSTTEVPEDAFLSEIFDPQTITKSQPLKIKELTDEAIDWLELDEIGKRILKTLFDHAKAIHISELATQCQQTTPEVNAYIGLILHALWTQWFVERIEVENDFIKLIK